MRDDAAAAHYIATSAESSRTGPNSSSSSCSGSLVTSDENAPPIDPVSPWTLGLPQDSSYFDLADFLVDQSPVEVICKHDAPFAAPLLNNSGPNAASLHHPGEKFGHLKKGTCIVVPLAAATIACSNGLADVILPAVYGDSVLDNLRRNPTVINVAVLHPYYFELGLKLAAITKDARLAETLLNAQEERLVLLMNVAAEDAARKTDSYGSGTGASFAAALGMGSLSSGKFCGPSAHHSKTGGPTTGPTGKGSVTTTHGAARRRSLTSFENLAGRSVSVSKKPVNVSLFLRGLTRSEERVLQQRKAEIQIANDPLVFPPAI